MCCYGESQDASAEAHLLRVREGVAAVYHHLRAKDLGSARHERDGHARPIVRLEAELRSRLECDRAPVLRRLHRGRGLGWKDRNTEVTTVFPLTLILGRKSWYLLDS